MVYPPSEQGLGKGDEYPVYTEGRILGGYGFKPPGHSGGFTENSPRHTQPKTVCWQGPLGEFTDPLVELRGGTLRQRREEGKERREGRKGKDYPQTKILSMSLSILQ